MTGPRLIHAKHEPAWRLEVAERMARRERRRRMVKWAMLGLTCAGVVCVVAGLALPVSALRMIALVMAETAAMLAALAACYVLVEIADADMRDGRDRGER